jgi:hypothetical protein
VGLTEKSNVSLYEKSLNFGESLLNEKLPELVAKF